MKNLYQLFLIVASLAVSIQVNAQSFSYDLTKSALNVGNPGLRGTTADNTSTGSTIIHQENAGGGNTTNAWSGVVNIPFPFSFYGSPVSNFCVSKNGLLTFKTSLAGTTVATALNTNQALPSASVPDSTIAYFWEDFATSALGTNDDVHMYTLGFAPNRELFIHNFSYKMGTSSFNYFAVVLQETTNRIYIVDQNFKSTNITATVGAQLNSTTAVQFTSGLNSTAGSPNIVFGAGNQVATDNEYYILTQKQLVNNNLKLVDVYANDYCNGSDTLRAIVKNDGTNTVSTYNIGGNIASTNFTPAQYTSAIAAGATDTVIVGTYNFVAGNIANANFYTYNPNNVIDAVPGDDTLGGMYGGLTGTYTVGGTSPDYIDLNAAVNSLENNSLCGVITLHIRQGTYSALDVKQFPDASAIKSVSFRPDPSNTADVIIRSSGDALILDGANFVSFTGLTIETTSASNNAIEIKGLTENITLDSNKIIASASPSSTTSTNSAVIYNLSGAANKATNLKITNNEILNGSYGIYAYGGATTDLKLGTEINNNEITNYTYRGAMVYYTDGAQIKNNYIRHKANSYTGPSGIYVAYLDKGEISGNDILVTGTTNSYGIYMSNTDGTAGAPVQVHNNMLSLPNASTSTSNNGMYITSSTYVKAFHNSVYTKTTSTSTSAEAVYFYATTGSEFRNNAVVNDGTGRAYSVSTTPTRSNNAWFTQNATTGNQAVDATSVNVNANFFNPSTGDLHVNTAGLNDAGTPIATVTTDIDGDARSATTPDIGADEFIIITRDAAVTEVANQVFCTGANDVFAKVKNLGINTLTSLSVGWGVSTNGGSPVAQTNLVLTGINLAPGEDSLVNLGSFSFASGNSYSISAYSFSPNGLGDQKFANDTANTSGLETSLQGSFTVGGTSPDYPTIDSALSNLNSKGICGHTTLLIRQGTYPKLIVNSINGASATSILTIRPDPANTSDAIIRTTSGDALWLIGSKFITFKGLTIETTATSGNAVQISGLTENITLDSNKLIASASPSSTTSTNSAVIYNFTGAANKATNLKITNNEILNGSYSIYTYGGGTTDLQAGTEISNNEITNYTYRGVMVYYTDGAQIKNNYIRHKSNSYTVPAGIYTQYLDKGEISGNDVLVTGTTNSYGIYMTNSDGTAGDPVQIHNNMLSLPNASTSTSNNGMYITGTHVKAFHNSVYTKTTSTSTSAEAVYFYATTGSEFRNNAVVNDGTGRAYSASGTPTRSNNAWFTQNATLGNPTVDGTSINVNPNFFDPSIGDLHVNSQPLKGAGTPIASVTTDIDGDARNATTPDIGADEFILISRDAGVTEVANQVLCVGANDVFATVKNLGIDTLTSLSVGWTVATNSAAAVSQTNLVLTGINLLPGVDTVVSLGSFTFAAGNTYAFSAYSFSPNGFADQKLENDTASMSGLKTGISGTFTVGGTSPDFATLNLAVSALDNGICGPVTFNVRQGTYNEQVSISNVNGGAMSWVTFQGDPANTADAHISFGSDNVWKITNSSYIRLDGLSLEMTGLANVLEFSGMNNHITLNDNKFEGYNTTTNSTNYHIIYDPSGATNMIDNITITNNEIVNGAYGVYMNGTSTTVQQDSIIITGNDFVEHGEGGVYLYYAKNSLIDNNDLSSRAGLSSSYGIYAYYAATTDITNNTIMLRSSTTSYGNGLYMSNCRGTAGNRSLVANNMVAMMDPSTNSTHRNYFSGCNYNDIVNNSFYARRNSTSTIGGAVYLTSGTNLTFQNNSIYNNGDGYALDLATTAGHTRDYNNVFSTGTNGHVTGGTIGTNSISLDPVYVNNASPTTVDLHAASAVLDGLGTPLAFVTEDIDGDTRNATTPDIGADEFNASKDVRISNYTLPSGPCYSDADTVWIELKNAGIFTLDFSVDNFTGYYNVSNASSQSGSRVYNSGTLAAGATVTDYIILDFSNRNTHDIELFLSSTWDADNSNDTVRVSLEVTKPDVPNIANNTFCDGDSLNFAASIAGGVNYSWYSDSLLTSSVGSGAMINLGFASSSTPDYWVTATGSNGCEGLSTKVTSTVNALPTVSFASVGNVCESNSSISLSATPSGGTFSGTGVSGSSANAGSMSTGNNVLTYTYTDGNSCTNSDTSLAIVNLNPTVNATFTNLTSCTVDNASISISASGGTGTYTYSNNAGSSFQSSNSFTGLGSGSYTVVVNDGVCEVTDSIYTAAAPSAPPSPSASNGGTYCDGATLNNLTGAFGTGGGAGSLKWFTDGAFTQSVGTGTSVAPLDSIGTIVYFVIEEDAGCKSAADTVSVTIDTVPVVNHPAVSAICDNEAPISLTGGSPTGGAYSGTGVSGSSFDPSVATAGNHNIVYTYTDGNNCSEDDTITITVNGSTAVSLSALSNTCDNASAVALTGTPTGGTFTGTGVSGSNFNPTTAGANTHSVIYSFTNTDNCTTTDTQSVVVNSAPSVSISSIAAACLDASPIALSGLPTGTGGIFSGAGVSGSSLSPTMATAGTHSITYSYTDANSCTDSASTNAVVNALPVVTASALSNICGNDAAMTLSNGSATPAGGTGTYVGSGVTSGVFNPSSVTSGATYSLGYAYVDLNGCTDTDFASIFVDTVPTVTASAIADMCADTADFALSNGLPAGGSYLGTNVTAGSFSAGSAGAGAATVNYSFADLNGCADTATFTITVKALPVVSFTNPANVCANDTAFGLSSGTPVGGTYSGTVVTAGRVNPAAIGSGSYNLRYDFTNTQGCKNSDTAVIVVDTVPVVTSTAISNACDGDASITLSFGLPSGGVYSLNGTTLSSYAPTAATVDTIMYVFTDGNGCSDMTTETITVNALPTVTLSALSAVCANTPSFSLSGGAPTGGTYSGTGVAAGSFDGSTATAGTYKITYEFTDANNCVNIDTQNIVVNTVDAASLTLMTGICSNDTVQALTGGLPAGGVYSGSAVNGNGEIDPLLATSSNVSVTYTFTNANNCVDSASQMVMIVAPPVFSITGEKEGCGTNYAVLRTDAPANSMFNWSTGVTTDSAEVTDTTASTIWVEVTDTTTMYNCASRDTVEVTYLAVCVSVDEALKNTEASFYPNPNNGIFNYRLSGFEGMEVNLTVVSMGGQLVYEASLDNLSATENGTLELDAFESGIYFINVSTESGSSTYRISINK